METHGVFIRLVNQAGINNCPMNIIILTNKYLLKSCRDMEILKNIDLGLLALQKIMSSSVQNLLRITYLLVGKLEKLLKRDVLKIKTAKQFAIKGLH